MKKMFILCIMFYLAGCATVPGRDISVAKRLIKYSGMAENVTLNYFTMEQKLIGRKNSFSLDEAKATWWAQVWDTTMLPLNLHAEWLSPDGALYKSHDFLATGSLNGIISASLPIKNNILPNQQGEWKVNISFRGNPVDSQEFYIGKMQAKQDKGLSEEELKKIFPNLSKADALILLSERRAELDKDFSTTLIIKRRVKILSERGKELYSTVNVPFYYGLDSLDVNMAHTVKSDGEILDAKEINVFSPYEDKYPSYKGSRILSITMPAVEVGSVLEYEIELESSMGQTLPNFYESFYSSDLNPVLEARFVIICPQDIDLKVNQSYVSCEPKISFDETEKKKTYTWQLNNRKAIEIEKYMPARREVCPYMSVFTQTTWGDIANWWRELSNDKLLINSEIAQKAQELIKDASTSTEKVKAIFSFVQDNIRYVQIPFGASPHAPASVAETFKNRYGDCKDQSALLIAVLKAAGIKDVYFGLTRTKNNGSINKNIPSASEFDHVVVVVKLNDKELFLDPAAEKLKFGLVPFSIQGSDVFVVDKEGYFITIPFSEAEDNQIQSYITLAVDKDLNIAGKLKVVYLGQNEWNMREFLQTLEPKQRDELVHALLLNLYPGAIIKDYEIRNESGSEALEEEINFSLSNWIEKVGDMYLLKFMSNEIMQPPGYLGVERKYPLLSDFKQINKSVIEIKLPDNLILKNVLKNYSLETKYLESSIKYSQKSNNIIVREQSIGYLAMEIVPEEINEYRRIYDEIYNNHKQGLVLRKKQEEGIGEVNDE